MRQLVLALATCGLIGALLPAVPACDGGDGDGDADGDGDGDADCDPEGTTGCEEDFDCCDGLSCTCESPPCNDSEFVCAVCQPMGEGCNTSLECCRDAVCVGHVCVPVFDRDYEVQIVSDSIYERNNRDGGNYWDPCVDSLNCTPAEEVERAPDPYVTVIIGDTEYTTTTRQNEYSTFWQEETFIAHIANHTPYTAYIYDEDGAEDAVVLDWGHEVEPTLGWVLLARTLRMGGMMLPEPTASPTQYTKLQLMFVPQP
jgi:hypothetical protein